MNSETGFRLRLAWGLVLGGLCLIASDVMAQQPEGPGPPPPGGAMLGLHRPGGVGEVLHGEIGEGKTVTGTPLTADVVVSHSSTLADGNRIYKENHARLYRDSQGRVRREVTLQLATPTTGNVTRTVIIIRDPVAGKRYMLDPDTKTAREMPLKHGPGHGPGNPPDDARKVAMEKSISEQDLGTKSINGMSAEGVRVTRTIPAGEIGNEKPIEVVTERWYSTDLQIPVLITHTDPMMGSVTTKLTAVTRGEPDASLFQVPSDYRVVSGGPGEPFQLARPPK